MLAVTTQTPDKTLEMLGAQGVLGDLTLINSIYMIFRKKIGLEYDNFDFICNVFECFAVLK